MDEVKGGREKGILLRKRKEKSSHFERLIFCGEETNCLWGPLTAKGEDVFSSTFKHLGKRKVALNRPFRVHGERKKKKKERIPLF